MSKMIQVTASDLYQIREALSAAMTARSAADVYDARRMALVKIEKLLHGDDAPPPPVDYAAKYGLHGMTAVEAAKLVYCLSSYAEIGAVLDAWRIANEPAPELEPDMFWPVDDADEPLSLKHLIDAADSDGGVAIEVYCAKSMPNRKIRAWREGDGVEHRVCWEWINETPDQSTHI